MTCGPCIFMLPAAGSISAGHPVAPDRVFLLFLSCSFLPHRKQDRCKLCHFNPFEFFDHAGSRRSSLT